MKKYALILMIFILIMSVTSCKRMPEDTAGADIPAQGTQAEPPKSDEQQKPEEQPENPDAENKDNKEGSNGKQNDVQSPSKAETDADGVKEESNVTNAAETEKTDVDTAPVEPSSKSDLKTGPDSWVTITEEKAPPCKSSLDEFVNNYFTEGGGVDVYIMREQSAARQVYTADDFPGVDIEMIIVSEDYDSESNSHLLLSITLSQPDKKTAYEAIKTLEQNPIVFEVCPQLKYAVRGNYTYGKENITYVKEK